MAVGGHHQPRARRRRGQPRAVVALAQELVVELAQEQLLDQLRTGAAARAVVHVDAAVLEVERADVVGLHCHRAASATTAMSLNRPYW